MNDLSDDLSGKVIFLTGATDGIGRLTAEALAARGATLLLHGRDDLLPTESSSAWARALPDARVLVLEDCARLPWVEQPERFFAAVNPFLSDGTWPADAARE